MILRLKSLGSRTLALLVLLGVLFGCYRLIVAPVLAAYQAGAQSIEHSRMLLERYHIVAAQRDELATHVAAREMAGENAAYFGGPTGALATAALQDHVGSVIVQAGGELHSTQVLPSEPVNAVAGVSRSRLRLDLSVGIEALERLLYNLESSEPYIFIDWITIRAQTRDGEQRSLAVNLEVYCYARTAEL